MGHIPEEIQKICEKSAARYPVDIMAATNDAIKKAQALRNYKEFVEAIVFNSFQELIYDARHKTNVQLKREANFYGEPAKVRLGDAPIIETVYKSLYDYCIGGVTLGELTGKQLDSMAESEELRGKGLLFNSLLLRWAKDQGVGDDVKLRDAITERKLRTNFRRLQLSVYGNQQKAS